MDLTTVFIKVNSGRRTFIIIPSLVKLIKFLLKFTQVPKELNQNLIVKTIIVHQPHCGASEEAGTVSGVETIIPLIAEHDTAKVKEKGPHRVKFTTTRILTVRCG